MRPDGLCGRPVECITGFYLLLSPRRTAVQHFQVSRSQFTVKRHPFPHILIHMEPQYRLFQKSLSSQSTFTSSPLIPLSIKVTAGSFSRSFFYSGFIEHLLRGRSYAKNVKCICGENTDPFLHNKAFVQVEWNVNNKQNRFTLSRHSTLGQKLLSIMEKVQGKGKQGGES